MIYIYDKELKLIEKLNCDLKKFKNNPIENFPLWKSEYLVSKKEYLEPNLIKIENGEIVEKTLEELKIEGLKPLEAGEYVENSKILKIEKPTEYRIWNKESNTWDIENTLIANKRKELLNGMTVFRDKKQSTGTIFEENKIIKGRSSDSSDALGQKALKESGESINWFFSSGQIEYDVSIERITKIAMAIGNFRTKTLTLEAIVSEMIVRATPEEIENFDVDNAWELASHYQI